MKIRSLIEKHQKAFTDHYGQRLLPGHRKALDAMLACRRDCGDFLTHCQHCNTMQKHPLSCGHRSCPQCQNQLGEQWLERQSQKLLPVTYFMVTFTLPQELRSLAWQHQALVYDILLKAAAETLQTIGKNNHGIQLGMTAILHTHTRTKDYHPHVHIVLPGGGLMRKNGRAYWKTLSEDYLVNEFAMARVFRGIFLRKLFEQSLELPNGLPKQWVAHVRNVGKGEKALAYLSYYLYRGVISENDILADQDGSVTFQYKESKTNTLKTEKLSAPTFLWKLIQHVLPRGFRRVRDIGFLHGNAKKILKRIQFVLKVTLPPKSKNKKKMKCKSCFSTLTVLLVEPKRTPMRFRFYTVSDETLTPG